MRSSGQLLLVKCVLCCCRLECQILSDRQSASWWSVDFCSAESASSSTCMAPTVHLALSFRSGHCGLLTYNCWYL